MQNKVACLLPLKEGQTAKKWALMPLMVLTQQSYYQAITFHDLYIFMRTGTIGQWHSHAAIPLNTSPRLYLSRKGWYHSPKRRCRAKKRRNRSFAAGFFLRYFARPYHCSVATSAMNSNVSIVILINFSCALKRRATIPDAVQCEAATSSKCNKRRERRIQNYISSQFESAIYKMNSFKSFVLIKH